MHWGVRWLNSLAGQHLTCVFYGRALKIFFLGTMTTSRVYGKWNSGYHKPRLPRHARTMLRIVFSVLTGCGLFPSTPTCVSVTAFLGLNELTQGV